MNTSIALLSFSVLMLLALRFTPRNSVREAFCASMALAGLFAIPVFYLLDISPWGV